MPVKLQKYPYLAHDLTLEKLIYLPLNQIPSYVFSVSINRYHIAHTLSHVSHNLLA